MYVLWVVENKSEDSRSLTQNWIMRYTSNECQVNFCSGKHKSAALNMHQRFQSGSCSFRIAWNFGWWCVPKFPELLKLSACTPDQKCLDPEIHSHLRCPEQSEKLSNWNLWYAQTRTMPKQILCCISLLLKFASMRATSNPHFCSWPSISAY